MKNLDGVRRLLTTLVVIVMVCLVVVGLPQPAYSADLTPTPTDVNDCQAVLSRAFETLHNVCNSLDRNQACYGNNQVNTQLIDTAVGSFNTPGDKMPIQAIKMLSTSPLNIQTQTWGLSLLKLKVNIPNTLPGQNVLFLVYGDTSITNQSGDMRAFYFSSGLNNPNCQEAPSDGILVRSPNHLKVVFTANGVQFSIASTLVLRATANRQMTAQLIEGSATVSNAAGTQRLQPGQFTTVQLGGKNGLEPVSAPSRPASASLDRSTAKMLGAASKLDDPNATITLNGCITAIQGNTYTINGYSVVLPANLTQKAFQVGDCIQLDGTFKVSDEGVIVVTGKRILDIRSNANNGNSGDGGKPEDTGKPEKTPKPEKTEKPEKTPKPEKTEKP
jgi:hypothetical protein